MRSEARDIHLRRPKRLHRRPGECHFQTAGLIHKSLDGANYARWRSREDFEAIFANPEVREHMREAEKLATVEPTLYEVSYTHEAL